MNEKTSPGPWAWKKEHLFAASGELVLYPNIDEGITVARAADARLIAAAPEMLELLRDVKRWGDRELREPCDSNVLDALIDRIDGKESPP